MTMPIWGIQKGMANRPRLLSPNVNESQKSSTT